MIGRIIFGKSFGGCLRYCLDKKEAEVLDYNLCYGDSKELSKQFNDVRKLNPDLSKPVEHITLSFPKGEQSGRKTLENIAENCARDLGFEKNQYVVVIHHDTDHPHIHIVVNRVGFDGKTVKDGNNYRKMADFCRRMEKKHGLQQVLSPRKFLPREQQNQPRSDARKEKLRTDIRECLAKSRNYEEFEALMKRHGYEIYKARGIAFTDKKKVRIKGSEVGYSLQKIERILTIPQEKRMALLGRPAFIRKRPILQLRSTRQNLGSQKPGIQQENLHPALIKKKRKRK